MSALNMSVGIALCMHGLVVAQAHAQSFIRDRNESVEERSEQLFPTKGIEVGAFHLFPALTTGIQFDDNLRGTIEDTEQGVIAFARPGMRLESDWGRHELVVEAGVNKREVFQASDQSTLDASIGGTARYDALTQLPITGFAQFASRNELRTAGSAGGALVVEPIAYTQVGLGAGLEREFARFRARSSVENKTLDYDDSVILDSDGVAVGVLAQDFRDRSENSIELRGDFAWSPASSVFAEYEWTAIDYDQTRTGEQTRSGTLTRQSVGVEFDALRAFRGEVKLGGQTRQFDDAGQLPARDDQSGFTTSGEVEWFVTPIITASFGVSKSLVESQLDTSAVNDQSNQFVRVDYEVRRHIILTAELARQNEVFEDFAGFIVLEDFGAANASDLFYDREDTVIDLTVGGVYRFNRFVGVEGTFRRYEREIAFSDPEVVSSNGVSAGEILNNSVGVNLVLQY